VITAIMSGVLVLRTKRIDISEWFVSLVFAATAFGFGSLALGVSRNFRQITTSTGENLQATGFNGAFLHPNLHATYATLFVTYLLLIWILGGYRKTWLAVPGIASWFLFMSWSGSRTSIIASFLGAVGDCSRRRCGVGYRDEWLDPKVCCAIHQQRGVRSWR
jgi:hypothetical protein